MTKLTNVIAVKDSEGAGAIVWWRLSGNTDRQKVEDAWTLAGLPEELLSISCTPLQTLNAALGSVAENRLMRRSLGVDGEYAMIREEASGKQLSYHEECRVALKGEELVTEGANQEMQEKIRAAYSYQQGVYGAYEVSMWLAGRVIPEMDALSLRDKGGIYYIPAHRLPLWRQIVETLREVSGHRMFEVAALKTDEAVAAILDAIEREAGSLIEKMETELIEDDPTPRVLRNRIRALDEMAEKVTSYEQLLGTNVETLRERLSGLNAQLAAAIITASGPDAE